MGLRLILGRAGSGKSNVCIEEIRNELRQNPLGKPLILLVPEQSTHQMDIILANTKDLGGTFRAQVLSFKRLVWKVLSETGGNQKVLISDAGKRMILKKVLIKNRLDLRAFAHTINRFGMTECLAAAISEFKIYRHAPADLRRLSVEDETLTGKLQDLALLYEHFQLALDKNFIDPDDELSVLAQKIPSTSSLRKAKIWVDGFKGFTPQELDVLQELLKVAEEVNITLPLDPRFMAKKIDPEVLTPEDELFSDPWQTYQELQRLALETTETGVSITLLQECLRFKQNPWLAYLEKQFFAYPLIAYPQEQEKEGLLGSAQTSIRLAAAVNRRTEVEWLAREIRRLVREEGLRWREIGILTRGLSGYQDLLAQIFTAYEIPCFLDYKHSILHHPVIELIVSVIETVSSDWAYEPLFRCLKTDLFPLKRDEIDRLENYCLAHGLQGRYWDQDKDWTFSKSRDPETGEEKDIYDIKLEEEINRLRVQIQQLFRPFIRVVAPNSSAAMVTLKQVVEALYLILVSLNVPDQLQNWSREARSGNNLAEALLQEQLWPSIINLMDELVVNLGEEILSLEDFAAIFVSGLETLKLGLIPPGLDQVLAGSLERSRTPEVRVLFLLGASEGVLPARLENNGVLSTDDRSLLHKAGFFLAPKGKIKIFEEQFFIYTALTRATEKLYVTYPLTDEEGRSLGISPVIARLKILFPQIKEEFWAQNPDDLNVVSHPGPLLQYYALQIRSLPRSQVAAPLWQAVGKWFAANELSQNCLALIEQGIAYRNQEERIKKSLTHQLYGKRLQASVSRLEQFAACPFAHFACYGLQLKERSVYQLANPDIGQFFHALLYDFTCSLQTQGLDWGCISKEKSWELLNESRERVAPRIVHNIFRQNARNQYLCNRLQRTVYHAVQILGRLAQQGIFKPVKAEVRFGPGENLESLEIPLSEDDSLIMRGQIDRIDRAVINEELYLRIIDYKSSAPAVTLDKIYYGLNLQLLTYLDIALRNAKYLMPAENYRHLELEEILLHPAGFLYFPVIEPLIAPEKPMNEEQLESLRLKAMKISGYILAEHQVVQAMDEMIRQGQSDLLGIKLNKDGSFSKRSNVLTEKQFTQLRKHLYTLLKQAGKGIMAGNITIAPYKYGNSYGCQYCPYKPVCRFDSILPENTFRIFPKLKFDEVWELILRQSGDTE
ncbi:MAG TPA: helicase-exonuclease AddAB subunit AddB [Desulfitobacteriaceae bacterium]|nr:helicase-exonuclease AddAB subunit AddB [Desulfitobacteriaceae bacterium]